MFYTCFPGNFSCLYLLAFKVVYYIKGSSCIHLISICKSVILDDVSLFQAYIASTCLLDLSQNLYVIDF